MRVLKPGRKQKNRAQAMVEFALAIPILLVVVYGLLETGRVLFIYASTVMAAREAVRYGSAMGVGPSGVPYYQDCDGIRAAARKVGFVNTFTDITISYDGGLDNSGNPTATKPACGSFTDAQNGDRIIVSVSTDWSPVVPLVPLKPLTITSRTARTIIAYVSIPAPAALPPGLSAADATSTKAAAISTSAAKTQSVSLTQTAMPTPTLTPLPPTATPAPQPLVLTTAITQPGVIKAGDLITYDFTIQNINSVSLTNLVVTVDGNGTITLDPACPTSVNANSQVICRGTRAVTQAEIDSATALVNSASASGFAMVVFPVYSNTDTSTVTITQTKALSIFSLVGTFDSGTVNYTYQVVNQGNVTLTNLKVNDSKTSINCASTTIAPGQTTTCTGTYSVSQPELSAGSVVNTGTAQAEFSGNTYYSSAASTTVVTSSFAVTVTQNKTTVTPDAPTLTYTYTIQNTGSVVLNKPYTISSTLNTALLIASTGGPNTTSTVISPDCSAAAASINPGASVDCVYVYTHPSTSGSTAITNTMGTANINGVNSSSISPASLAATAYNCTTSNFTVGSFSVTSNQVKWTITNKVGINLPISSVTVSWSNSGSGSSRYQLTGVSVNNSSSLSASGLPDINSPYTSGAGSLTGSSSSSSATTITFTFSLSSPVVNTATINIGAPYTACTRTK